MMINEKVCISEASSPTTTSISNMRKVLKYLGTLELAYRPHGGLFRTAASIKVLSLSTFTPLILAGIDSSAPNDSWWL
jgi:hypothetical protein